MAKTLDELNFAGTSGGSFDMPMARLQSMTIHHNAKVDRYYVTDDRDGRTLGAGYESVDAAEKAHKYADELRRKIW